MAGLLTHLSFGLVGAIIILLIFYKSNYKWLYAPVFFIGNIMPDLVDFGITGLRIGSLTPEVIMRNDWFSPLARFSHNFWHWLIFTGLIIAILAVIHWTNKKIVSRKLLIAAVIASVFLLIAVAIHLNLDFYVIERFWWI